MQTTVCRQHCVQDRLRSGSMEFDESFRDQRTWNVLRYLKTNKHQAEKMVYLKEDQFGSFKGEPVRRFTWSTDAGLSVSVISYGAIITSIKFPDKYNFTKDVVLGFDDFDGYLTRNKPYLGAIIGRCANRIGGGQFQIDGKTYQLAQNIGNDHLHGGILGFDKANWNSNVEGNKVTLSYLSKNGEEGYPGDLITNVTYSVTDDGVLHQDIVATTTRKTVVNLTNHSYFNLAGHESGAEELFNHYVTLNADKITETSSNSIPTGKLLDVIGTPFDLRTSRRLGDIISIENGLFDNNFCITQHDKGLNDEKEKNFVASALHPSSGRFLEVYSDQPGVQLYTSNFLPAPSEDALVGKDGAGYRRHGALCFETQNFPDAVNHGNFPTSVLSPGNIYVHRVEYRFGVKKSTEPNVVHT